MKPEHAALSKRARQRHTNTEEALLLELSRRPRRGVVFGFVTAAMVLALASASFACTIYKGRFTVQGNGYTEKTAVGENKTGMTWCYPVPTASLPDDKGADWEVRIHVSPQTADCPGSLPNGTYYIDAQKGAGYVGDCMHGSSGNTTLGTMKVSGGYSVDSNGNWVWYYYNYTTTPGEGTICVSDYNANYGNQMAVDFI